MPNRLRDVEYSCRIIDKTLAIATTIRQITNDPEIVKLAWDVDSNLEDIRRINEQLRGLANEYIVMIDELNSEIDGSYEEIQKLNWDIDDLKEESKSLCADLTSLRNMELLV